MNMRWISLLVSYHFLSFILFSRVNPIRELIIIEPVVCETNLTYIGFVSLKYGIYDRHNPKTGEFEKIPLLAGWDIVTMPSFHSDIQKQFGMDIRPMCLNAAEKLISFNYIFLIQVKTNEMPKTAYIKTLKDFQVPFYVKKELHIWNDRQKEPDIIDL